MCGGQTIVIVGGGNSAGQAAVFMSKHAEEVKLLIRGDDLASLIDVCRLPDYTEKLSVTQSP